MQNASIIFGGVLRSRNGALIFQCLQTEYLLQFLQTVIHRFFFTFLRIILKSAADFQKMLFPPGEQNISNGSFRRSRSELHFAEGEFGKKTFKVVIFAGKCRRSSRFGFQIRITSDCGDIAEILLKML